MSLLPEWVSARSPHPQKNSNSHAKETLPKGIFLQPNNQNTTFTFPFAFLHWSIANKIHENGCAENDYQQKNVTVSKWIKGLKGSWSQRKQITEMRDVQKKDR